MTHASSTAASIADAMDAAVRTITRTFELPAIGTHWIEQGGIFAGICRGQNGAPDFALIIAADTAGHLEDQEYGEYGQEIEGAKSPHDGPANTVAMAGAGSKLAQAILDLKIGCHADWYLPSSTDLHMAYANVPDHFEKGDWYWTSTQYSRGLAWVQHFGVGDSNVTNTRNEFRAVAVRRLPL